MLCHPRCPALGRRASSSRASSSSGGGVAPRPAGRGAAAAAAARSSSSNGSRRQRAPAPRAQAGDANDFGESVKRIAKKIQGSLPIVGLLSRLTSPEGGFDEIAYPEFCRSVYDRAGRDYFDAVTGLEAAHGKPAAHRMLLMVLWMAQYGVGIVPAKDMVGAARRVRVTHDIDMEVERFEGNRDIALKKYPLIERPAPQLSEQVDVAVDCLATLAMGLAEGAPIPADDAPRIAKLVTVAFPEARPEAVMASIEARPKRTYA